MLKPIFVDRNARVLRSTGVSLKNPKSSGKNFLEEIVDDNKDRNSPYLQEQSGAVEACWAHNPEVRGSKPRSAILFFSFERSTVHEFESAIAVTTGKTLASSKTTLMPLDKSWLFLSKRSWGIFAREETSVSLQHKPDDICPGMKEYIRSALKLGRITIRRELLKGILPNFQTVLWLLVSRHSIAWCASRVWSHRPPRKQQYIWLPWPGQEQFRTYGYLFCGREIKRLGRSSDRCRQLTLLGFI